MALCLRNVKTKYLKTNHVAVKLTENRDKEGRILKKQLKLICLLRSIFLKAEGNFRERKKLKLCKKSVMELYYVTQ